MDRAHLYAKVLRSVKDSSIVAIEKERVSLVKALLSFLPESILEVKAILERFRTSLSYEMHFTVFCYLDSAAEACTSVRQELLNLVRGYLEKVPSETADAAWMAGDLLGDHWALAESGPVLVRLLRTAPSAAARKAVLHGLEMALGRSELGERERRAMIEAIARAAARDNDQECRILARNLLKMGDAST